jgi:hypothetical protein
MTDRDVILAMLKKIGVDPKEPADIYNVPGGSVLVVEAGDSPQVIGYMGCVTHFYFSPEGDLVKMGIWE